MCTLLYRINIIHDALHKEGIRTSTPISPLKAGFLFEDFAHITSFKRQVYIDPENMPKLSSLILIHYEETNFRIFITDDTITCFLCK